MKKGLRGFFIAVAVVFGLLVVMAVLGNTVFSDAEPDSKQSAAPGAAPAEPDSKNSELLIRLASDRYIAGLLFEDGTYVAVDGNGGTYRRASVDKEGTCFVFCLDGYETYRSEPFDLKAGMVVFLEAYGLHFNYLYIYREHSMKGIPVILLGGLISGDDYDLTGQEITVKAGDASTEFSFSGKPGKDKIVKIPAEGATSIWYTRTRDGLNETLEDAFGKPVPVKVTEPYSIVENDSNGHWRIVPPVVQRNPVYLDDASIKRILSQGL